MSNKLNQTVSAASNDSGALAVLRAIEKIATAPGSEEKVPEPVRFMTGVVKGVHLRSHTSNSRKAHLYSMMLRQEGEGFVLLLNPAIIENNHRLTNLVYEVLALLRRKNWEPTTPAKKRHRNRLNVPRRRDRLKVLGLFC